MNNRILWVLVAILAVIIGLYPITYFFVDKNFGLLSTKSIDLLSNVVWNVGFYTHIILGGLALLIGWLQFSDQLRKKNLNFHRIIGKIYIISVLLSAIAAFGIAFFATGGRVPSLGFICLSLIWFYTTMTAYLSIRIGQVVRHQNMMIYSYAATFAAVTLRIWLPLLIAIFGDFVTAYLIVAWLCWVPNLIVAYWIVGKDVLPDSI
jgi:uncharacterized membrane protein